MLTKTDLNQFRSVVHEEVDVVVEKKLKPIKKDLRYLKKTVYLTVKNYDEGDCSKIPFQHRVLFGFEHREFDYRCLVC